MLKFYYHQISINSRRVWIALLEKNIEFEGIELKLNGDQFEPSFLALNPFHHIPVLEDDGFSVIESFAILDYLDAKYPENPLLPTDARSLALVRMVQMVTLNELLTAMNPLIVKGMGFGEPEANQLEESQQKVGKILEFLAEKLGEQTYFIDDRLTLADIVAGTAIGVLPFLGFSLDSYSNLKTWCDRLMQRSSWQQTQATPEQLESFKAQMKTLMAKKVAE